MSISEFKNISKQDYIEIAGPDWPTYEDFLLSEQLPDFIIDELETMTSELTPTSIFVGSSEEYKNFLESNYLSVVSRQTVLEIGPNHGIHTDIIQRLEPIRHVVIEPDLDCLKFLIEKYGDKITAIGDDALKVLQKTNKTDIVICFGVLYHLHSPLYLLELIANNCNPDIVLLDCVHSPDNLKFIEEVPNVPGNRFSTDAWKTANFNLVAPFEIIAQSMKHLGYKLIKKSNLGIQDYSSKSNNWLAMWQKIDTKGVNI